MWLSLFAMVICEPQHVSRTFCCVRDLEALHVRYVKERILGMLRVKMVCVSVFQRISLCFKRVSESCVC